MVYELFTVGAPFEHFENHVPTVPNVPTAKPAETYSSVVTIPAGSGGRGSSGGGVMVTTQNMPPGSGGFGTGTGVGGGVMATTEAGGANEMLDMIMGILDESLPDNAQKDQCMSKFQEAVQSAPPDFLNNFMMAFPKADSELSTLLNEPPVDSILGPCILAIENAARNYKEKTMATLPVTTNSQPPDGFTNYEGFANHADSEDYDAEDAEDGEDGEDAEDGADPEQNIVEDEDEESNNNNNSDGGIFDFFSKEKFTNQEEDSDFFTTGNNHVLKMDLLLRSVLYACLFYLLAHPETLASVSKNIPGVKKANSLLVMMGVFFLVYYILNLFI